MKPLRLKAWIGGFTAASFRVECQGGAPLIYSAGSPEDLFDVTPTEKAWAAFREDLDQIGVWQWQENYNDPDVLDGTQWEFEVQYPDRSIRCSGSNAYPDAQGQACPQLSAGFRRLLGSISALAGRRPFGCSP